MGVQTAQLAVLHFLTTKVLSDPSGATIESNHLRRDTSQRNGRSDYEYEGTVLLPSWGLWIQEASFAVCVFFSRPKRVNHSRAAPGEGCTDFVAVRCKGFHEDIDGGRLSVESDLGDGGRDAVRPEERGADPLQNSRRGFGSLSHGGFEGTELHHID